MSLTGECPYCDQPFTTPGDADELLGATVECPHCHRRGKFAVDEDGDYVLVGITRIVDARDDS